MDIKIRSIQSIKPSKSTPENLRNFRLSLLDQLASPSYINLIFYYKASGEVNISDRCTQLIKSLSEVLTLFYPLAGRITEDGLMVDCSDQGVMYLETQVSTRLDDFLQQGPKIDLVNQLIGAPDQVTTTLVIQVNVFDCGALVIGVSAAHKVTDASNLVRFINEWASTNRTGDSNGAFCPSFDNTASLFPPREISSSKYSLIPNDPEAIIVTKRFVFNGNTISKLRAKANSPNRKHSRVTLVASLIWKAIISIDQVKSGSFRDCLLAPAINLRGKAGSPISESSFGNVWTPYPIRFLQNKMESKFVDLVTAAKATAKKTTAKDPTVASFKMASFGAGAGANPSGVASVADLVGGEGGERIGSDDGETTMLEGVASETGGSATDSHGEGETDGRDVVEAVRKVDGAVAGEIDAIADPMSSAIDNMVTLMEAIVEKK